MTSFAYDLCESIFGDNFIDKAVARHNLGERVFRKFHSHQAEVLEQLRIDRHDLKFTGRGNIADVLHPEASYESIERYERKQRITFTTLDSDEEGNGVAEVDLPVLHVKGSRPGMLGRKVFDAEVRYRGGVVDDLQGNVSYKGNQIGKLEAYLRGNKKCQ